MFIIENMACPESVCIQMPFNEHFFSKGATNVTSTNNFDFGASLLTVYDILDNILDFLPYNDLRSLMQLNTSWSNCISEYLKKRLSPNVFCFSLHAITSVEKSCCYYIRPSLSLIFFNDKRIKLQNYVCIHEGSITNVTKKPVIQFIENNILSDEACPVVVLSCQQSDIFLPELYFNGFAFPTVPDVKITVVRISKDNKETPAQILNTKLGDDIITCLLSFCMPLKKSLVFKRLSTVVEAIQARQPEQNFAFGGGLVTGMKTFNAEGYDKKIKKTDDLLCVTFSIPKNENIQFDTYSLKITEKMIHNEQVEDLIIDFKKCYKKRKHSVALRFSCTSLDEYVEEVIQVFSKHFPNTKLSGFSCNGEIGWNNYKASIDSDVEEPENDPSPPKKTKKSETFVNYFTIIFVILSWGKTV